MPIAVWVAFHVLIIAMLAVDLGVFQRNEHAVGVKESLAWSAVWIASALLFNLGVYYWRGSEHALEFLTGYLLEKSLSVDNLFVFIVLFAHFRVPARSQHRVLFYGILGALFMRGALIGFGIALIKAFHWVIYVFGAFLVVTGAQLLRKKDEDIDPEHTLVVLSRRR